MTAGLLDRLDARLQEVGRRQHRFAWLTASDAAGEWLAVDAYYPSHRLLVLTHPDPAVRLRAAQLAREHGLAAVVLDPAADPEPILERLPAPPAPPANTPPAPRPVAIDKSAKPADGIAIGIALVLVVLLELYLAVVVLTVDDGHWLLGLIIVLDACLRAGGTLLAAARTHDRETVWGCLLIGSPAVIALLRR
jgi:hypothetical protein